VLGVVAALLGWQLSARELAQLIASKRAAGELLADAVARDLSAPLEFQDDDEVAKTVDRLGQSREVSHVSVFAGDKLVSSWHPEPGETAPPRAEALVRSEQIDLARLVVAPGPRQVGSLRLTLTLRSENEEYRAARIRIVAWSALLGLVTAVALILNVQRQVVGPLRRLAAAAAGIGRGQLGHVHITSRDELGDLGEAFNAMSDSIRDREQRLELANHNLRDLFDHMRQAIVAFGPDGRVRGATSRQAHILFRESALVEKPVRDLLYPNAAEYDIDAQAFVEWMSMAFAAKPEEWARVQPFAPGEVRLPGFDGDFLPVKLEFRPVVQDRAIVRIMLLATDVSAERALVQ
jgi:HAMP domain-containing protein